MKQENAMNHAELLGYLKQYIQNDYTLYRIWQCTMTPLDDYVIEHKEDLVKFINGRREAMGLDKIAETE